MKRSEKSVKREDGDKRPGLHVACSEWKSLLARFPQSPSQPHHPKNPPTHPPHCPCPCQCWCWVCLCCVVLCVMMCNPQSPITPVNPYLDALSLLSLKPLFRFHALFISFVCLLPLSLSFLSRLYSLIP